MDSRPRLHGGRHSAGKTDREGWVPASARTTGGGGRFANRPYVGVAEQGVGGQPQGLPLRRRHVGRDVDREEKGRFAYPSLRLVDSWVVWRGKAVRELPLRGNHRTRRRRATTRVAPTGAGMGPRMREDDEAGRQAAPMPGVQDYVMGPRMREDDGRGRVDSESPLRGSCRTRRRRATTRGGPTEMGLSVGGVGKMGPRIREDNGRGRAAPEPPLRGSRRTRCRRATTRVAPTETEVECRGYPGEDRREREGGFRTAGKLPNTIVDGRPRGLPVRRRRSCIREDDGRGEGDSRTGPTVGATRQVCRRAGLKPCPWRRRCSVGGMVKMGPRMHGDVREEEGRVRDPPLRGSRRTSRRATSWVVPWFRWRMAGLKPAPTWDMES